MPVVGAVAAPFPETRLIFSVDIDEACVWTWIASLLPKRSLRDKPRWRSDELGDAERAAAGGSRRRSRACGGTMSCSAGSTTTATALIPPRSSPCGC